jgi:hypothetical protein
MRNITKEARACDRGAGLGIVWDVCVCSHTGFSAVYAVYAKRICLNLKLYVLASSKVTELTVCVQT